MEGGATNMHGLDPEDTKLITCPNCGAGEQIEHGCNAEEYRCIICGGEMEEA